MTISEHREILKLQTLKAETL